MPCSILVIAGCGRTHPDPSGDVTKDDVMIPTGVGVAAPIAHSSLLYNEYPLHQAQVNLAMVCPVSISFSLCFHLRLCNMIKWYVWHMSICPSVRPASRVRSVAPTVLVGSISYLHILSSNFWRCVACKVACKISKFEFLAVFFFKFVTLTLSCFDLGSDVNH